MSESDHMFAKKVKKSDRLSQLPDEILCCIFSLLPLRDAVRIRSLMYRWRMVHHDTRSCLNFDTFNVFGKEPKCLTDEIQSKFVAAVDQFMKFWRGTKIGMLHVNFDLGKQHASHINRWIATAIEMGVEEVNLDFIDRKASRESYLFPLDLINSSSLKYLRLHHCKIECFPIESWSNHLTTLDLSHVPLQHNVVQRILSRGLNLTSFSLSNCCLPGIFSIDVRLRCLKNLAMDERSLIYITIKLDCPNLESYKYYGQSGNMIFAHVPKLRKVDIWFSSNLQPCEELFDNITRNVPQLEDLSLHMRTNVIQPISRDATRYGSLKKLDLHVRIPLHFDAVKILHLLNVSPSLEIFHLKMSLRKGKVPKQEYRRFYSNYLHPQLKEVKIEGFQLRFEAEWLVASLIETAVSLQRMIIKTSYSDTKRRLTQLLQIYVTKTSAEVIIE